MVAAEAAAATAAAQQKAADQVAARAATKPMEVPSSSAADLDEDDYGDEPNFGGSLPPAPPGGRAAPAAGARARIPGPLGALLSGELSGAAAEAAGGVGVQQSQPARPAFSPSKHYFRRAASWVRMEAELGVAGMEARCKLKSVLEPVSYTHLTLPTICSV